MWWQPQVKQAGISMALHDVAEQGEQAAGPAAEARHVGRADIAAAGLARVDTFERLGDDKAEGHGAEQEGEGHAEKKIEAGHEIRTFLMMLVR